MLSINLRRGLFRLWMVASLVWLVSAGALFQEEIRRDVSTLLHGDAGRYGVAAHRPDPGQADYSTANAFMDAYAKYRNNRVTSKQRQGQTLSINWPLWQEGGMRVDEATEKMMQSVGLIPMQTGSGIQALYRGLASGQDQVMVMEGNLVRMKQKLILMATR